jgi:hypothetical protein
MPRLFSAIVGLVIGYLDGAGLGAGSLDFAFSYGANEDLKIAMIAPLVTGPLGAVLGVMVTLLSGGGSDQLRGEPASNEGTGNA